MTTISKKDKNQQEGTIRFNLRTDKTFKRSGKAPIELIYQVRGVRKYYNTGEKIFGANWNQEDQNIILIDRKKSKKLYPTIDYDQLLSQTESDVIKSNLLDLKNQIREIEKTFKKKNIVYDAEMVVSSLKANVNPITKKTAPTEILFDFIDKYIQDHATTREPGSLSVYKAMKIHLREFEKETGKKITFSKIDYSFFNSFQNFLIEKRNLTNTTVAKQLSTVKTFLNYAKKEGVEISDKYKDFKIKKETLEVIALTNDEFERLYNMELSNNKRLAQVRDVFCFSCASGLRYSDLYQLKRENIKEDEIRITVKKTKDPLMVPLNPFSKSILDKYELQLKPLPVISNQKMNTYLKELCEMAEINEPIEIVRYRGVKREAITYPKYELIGVHTGRKTFVTLSLEKDMGEAEVMSITGHKDYVSFKRYVSVSEQRKKAVMRKAWGGKLFDDKLKAV
jgi:integrase